MTRFERRYSRFLAQDNAFAALSKNYDRVGKIIDISLGGLSFEYLYNDQHVLDRFSRINIFLTNNGFHLPDLTCKVIFDHPKRTTIQNASCTIQKNTCAVQFISLSRFQIDRLDFFIKNHTTGPAL